MSLLLDALRKSETQRRRGRAPELELRPLSAAARDRPRRRRRTWWLAAGVAGVALAAWQWPVIETLLDNARPGADPAAIAGADATGEQRSEAGTVEERVRTARAEAADRPPPVPASKDADSGTAARSAAGNPAADPVAAVAGSPARGVGSDGPRAAASTIEPAPADEAVQRSEVAASRAEEFADDVAARDEWNEASESGKPAAQPAAGKRSDGRAAPGGSEADAQARNGAIRPWELPQARRAEFPELALTVHFFAAEPAERFVLINGERYAQGDRIEGGLRLREILKRGVIVEFGDYRVLVE